MTKNQIDLLCFLVDGGRFEESEERIKSMLGLHRNVITSLWRKGLLDRRDYANGVHWGLTVAGRVAASGPF